MAVYGDEATMEGIFFRGTKDSSIRCNTGGEVFGDTGIQRAHWPKKTGLWHICDETVSVSWLEDLALSGNIAGSVVRCAFQYVW